MKYICHIIFAMTALSYVSDGIAKGNNSNVKRPSKSVAVQSYSPIFVEDGILPTEYLRNDPRMVFEWLDKIIKSVPGKPDQFSTDEDKKNYNDSLIGVVGKIKPIALPAICEKKYDASAESFSVIGFGFAIMNSDLYKPDPERMRLLQYIVDTKGKFEKTEKYLAQNGYGATSEVTHHLKDRYSIVYPSGVNSEPFDILEYPIPKIYENHVSHYISKIKMLPNEARENERHITCLAIFSLREPYILRFKSHRAPTRLAPYEMTEDNFSFYGKLDQIWVINNLTGEIYSKHARGGVGGN